MDGCVSLTYIKVQGCMPGAVGDKEGLMLQRLALTCLSGDQPSDLPRTLLVSALEVPCGSGAHQSGWPPYTALRPWLSSPPDSTILQQPPSNARL